MAGSDLVYLGISGLARLIERREVSPVEVTRAFLGRIGEVDKRVNAYITVLDDRARLAAEAAEKAIQAGDYLGPLHGIPIAVKDVIYTRGVRTTMGSRIFKDFVPEYDAAAVERLKRAGATLLGKLSTHEFALGPTNENPHFGPVRNPWDLERISGGSSGGSGAAVAAALCAGALGNDTGGSIRIPAALCGIVGLKATFGRVSNHGCFPLTNSQDHTGPLTRSVEDAAILLGAIAGFDPRDVATANRPVPDYRAALDGDIRGVRIGVAREYFLERLDPEVAAAVERALGVLKELGADVREVAWPTATYGEPAAQAILLADIAAAHERTLRTRAEDIGVDVRRRIALGRFVTAVHYLKAQRARALIKDDLRGIFAAVDVLASPTAPTVAFRIGAGQAAARGPEILARGQLRRLTSIFNLTGSPAMSVPCGFTAGGLPIGLQIAGRHFDEATVLRVAHAYERATPWHERRPAL
jgi:aspartyl-tRNA(Asn)/glutamyl-tRNA(Gln) amidotransferase subunit A